MFGKIISSSVQKNNYLKIIKENFNFEIKKDNKNLFVSTISKELLIKEKENKKVEKDLLCEMNNNTELSNINDDKNTNLNDEIVVGSSDEENENIEPVQTFILEENNLPESYNLVYNNVKIKNETNFDLTQDILMPNIEFKDKQNILIFHTHTCESYTQTEYNSYKASGNYRTTDLNYSVAKVGDVLDEQLNLKGFNVLHNISYHDYPSYNGSYSRSFNTVQKILSNIPNMQLVIDLHRDAIGSMNNYAPSVKIGDEVVAQLMFVIGTDGGGLEHPNWQINLKYAIKIQEKANEMYPGLFRPIILRNSRYNQNLADAACIIEVGATGNTLEQTTGAMKYLSDVIYETMK